MKRSIFFAIIVLAIAGKSIAQGCVAIRSTGAVCTRQEAGKDNAKGWQLNTSYRYFKSYKHFVGKEEQHERVDSGTDVRNWQHALNLTLVRHFNNRWSMSIDLPLISNRRSSMYEHYGNASKNPSARRSTHSSGLGDIRISAAYWLLNPEKNKKGNIQLGLGVKLATGNYKVEDYFWKNDTTYLLGPVDQSIQLGDGGTGITAELNAYYNFSAAFGVYGNFYYLLNPMEQNGVSTARGGTPNATAVKYFTNTMSVPDQYMIRFGGNMTAGNLMASAGIRMECIPSEDLVGGSRGFRRPGYVVSVEPAVSYKLKNVTVFAAVPVAIERNRTQSYSDKLRTQASTTKVQGDAAFADYSLNAGLSIRF
jgi:hypothetical protein